jgi:hypothetical protein
MEKVSHRPNYDVSQALACTYETTTNACGNIQRCLRILREKFIGIFPNEWAPADIVFCAASYVEDFLGTLSGKGSQDILSRADAQNSGGFFSEVA